MDKSYVPAFCSELKYLPTSSFRRSSVAAGTTSFLRDDGVLQRRTALAAARLRHCRHRLAHHVAGMLRVLQQHGDDLVHGNVIVLLVPAVVIGDHGDGDVAQLSFTSQAGFGQVGHADHVHAPTAIQIGLSFGRELRPFHVQIGAALLHVDAGTTASLGEHLGLFLADGMPKANVHDQARRRRRCRCDGACDRQTGRG